MRRSGQARGMARIVCYLAGLLALVLIGFPTVPASKAGAEEGKVQFKLSVQVSPAAGYATSQSMARDDWEAAWRTAAADPQEPPLSPVYTDLYLEIAEKGTVRKFAVREDGVLIEQGTGTAFSLPADIRSEWAIEAGKLRAKHYGELFVWKEAKSLLPLKAKFAVHDLETGLSFAAQRRAGSSHADVQPLTKEDTAVMKRIFGGQWSWKRRSIVVKYEGRTLAASMHGMPHGGDGIPDNGFSGHFCIHFLGSSTHGSGQTDLAHQLMARKAGGELGEAVHELPPEQLAQALFEAVNQQDEALLLAVLHGAAPEASERIRTLFDAAAGVRIGSIRHDPGELRHVSTVKLAVHGKGGGLRQETIQLELARPTAFSPWALAEFVSR